jgi:hypothetical protein
MQEDSQDIEDILMLLVITGLGTAILHQRLIAEVGDIAG